MMTIERARQILDSYGGRPENWPPAERAALETLLLKDTALREARKQALQLDMKLAESFDAADGADCEALARKIMASLPQREAEAARKPREAFGFSCLRHLWRRPAAEPVWMLAGTALAVMLAIGIARIDPAPVGVDAGLGSDAWMLMAETMDVPTELELIAVLEPELDEDDLDML